MPVRGLHAFEFGLQLSALFGPRLLPVGRLSFGGVHQRGRVELELSGEACALVADWGPVVAFLESLAEVRITRVDLAVDCLDGEFTVKDAVRWWKRGAFDLTRPAKSRLDGDWLAAQEGRTFYVGRAANGKMLRVYEKGKQLGDLASRWVRFEVQLGNRDRVIPFDVLLDPRRFFAGAYPCLERVACVAGEPVRTVRVAVAVGARRALELLRTGYGRWIDLFCASGVDPGALVARCRRGGLPRSVSGAIAASEVFAVTMKAAFTGGGVPCG